MSKELVIVFMRNPALGNVKTRLAAGIGKERALEVYMRLLMHTLREVERTGYPREAWYAGARPDLSSYHAKGFRSEQQHGEDLGARMCYAFQRAFHAGYSKVLIIGTDCPALGAGHIETAFKGLDSYDAVLGPTRDGGYYLLAMRRMIPELFVNKSWSSDTVAKDTMADLADLGLSCARLPELIDVDTESDLADVVLP